MSVPGRDPNKFEQVSSPGHKMPLAGGWGQGMGGHCTVRSYVCGGGPCTVRNNALYVMGPPVDRLTHTTENITFPQLHSRAVKMFVNTYTLIFSPLALLPIAPHNQYTTNMVIPPRVSKIRKS